MWNEQPPAVSSELLSEILNGFSIEDAIFHVFTFIRSRLPVRDILFFVTDRNRKILHLMIEYHEDFYNRTTFSKAMPEIVSWEALENSTASWRENCLLVNEANAGPDSASRLRDYLAQFPCTLASAILMNLRINREGNAFHGMIFGAAEQDALTDRHLDFLLELTPYLRQLTEAFLLSSPDPHLLLTAEGPLPTSPESLLRRCPGLGRVMELVDMVAPISSTVLVMGPTGTGKELVAETIHALSASHRGPLVKVNCGAIPDTLIDSELFGYDKGAFTGAVSARKGYFEQAEGGTIYLDEVGELSPSAQVRLLRVLESQEIRRLGSERRIPIHVRVIAATHRDLWDMVRHKQFREDLCYRLFVFPIALPALEKRPQDIPVIVDYFYKYYIQKFNISPPPILTHTVVRHLMTLPWPGNVRQLRYAVERAVILSLGTRSGVVRFDHDPLLNVTRTRERANPDMKETILRALGEAGGKIQGKNSAADILNLHPATLRSRMRALGIPLPRDRA